MRDIPTRVSEELLPWVQVTPYHPHNSVNLYRAWGVLKSLLSNSGLGIKAKKCLYEGVIVQTALHGAEAWGMTSAERRKVNVLEMKCLRSLV